MGVPEHLRLNTYLRFRDGERRGRGSVIPGAVVTLPVGSHVYVGPDQFKVAQVALVLDSEDETDGVHLWLESI